MAKTEKLLSDRDYQQTQRLSFNDLDGSFTTNGFLVGKLNRKILVDISVPNTTIYTFQELQNGTYVTLYAYTIVYTDSTKTQMVSAERTT